MTDINLQYDESEDGRSSRGETKKRANGRRNPYANTGTV